MAREFDVVIFGATGVTGRYAVEQMYKASKEEGLSFAVAGRNESKLNEALKEVAGWLEVDADNFCRSTPKIIADVEQPKSLREMAKRARIIVNTVGPYALYGEPVVSACVDEGTHHVDVSGEPLYMESMQLKYHQAALDKKIYLVSACGFDSIPTELLFNYTKESFRGRLNSVETVVSFRSPKGGNVNTGTWNSAIDGVASWNQLAPLRKKITETLFPKSLKKPKFKLEDRKPWATLDSSISGYILPFPSSDRSVVIKSEHFRNQTATSDNYQPVQIKCYLRVQSLFAAFCMAMVAGVFFLMTQFSCGRTLLKRYPAVFSFGVFRKGAPSREQLLAKSMKVMAVGRGWHSGDDENSPPQRTILCEMAGNDPAYIGTSTMLVQSAVCILKDSMAMPLGGGCLSPGFAFEKTTLLQRLNERKIKFSVVRQS